MDNQDGSSTPVHNTVHGDVSGAVIQLRDVHGGIAFHHHEAGVTGLVAVVSRIGPGSTTGMFVGREDEARQVLAALAPHSDARAGPVVVSAVAGMGGVGKSALARHCAVHAAGLDWFPGGVFWVDLQGYSSDGVVTAAAVISPLLRQLGVPPDRIPSLPADQMAVYDRKLGELSATPVLLVLDNASTADQLHGLLPTGDRHRAVITTRDTLGLPDARRLPLDVLPVADALVVLARTLHRQDPADDRVDRDPVGAARLAEVCDHLPLALLIAAGLLADEPNLTPGELAGQLAECGTAGFTHGETRLASVFATSYDRLLGRNPGAARMFLLLALAPGLDIATDAAASLADTSTAEARTLLRALRQSYLLTTANDRWRMHDLVRSHALDHALDGTEAALVRLLDHYLRTTRAAGSHLRKLAGGTLSDRFANRNDALDWLDAERPNLIAAQKHSAATQHHVIGLAAGLEHYLVRRRHLSDRLDVHVSALAAAHRLGVPDGIASASNYLGIALWSVRRFEDAATAHRTAHDLWREVGNRDGEGVALNNLGNALRELRRFDEAIAAHETARDIHQDTGDHLNEGMAWNNLGLVLQKVGRFDEAIVAVRRDLDICRELDDRVGEAMAWNNLGNALRELRRFDEAIAAHQTARDLHHDAGNPAGEGVAWNNLGKALRLVGRLDAAITALQTARDLHHSTGDRHNEGTTSMNLGIALEQARQYDAARASWERALVALRDSVDPDSVEEVQRRLEGLPGGAGGTPPS